MLSGVTILCFAASYSVALILEVSRLLFRSGVRGAVMLGFAAAGLVAHTAYLYYEAVHTTGAPLSSERDWCMVAAWVLAVVYLYLLCYHPRNSFGLFLLPLLLGLIAAGRFLAESEPFVRGPASKVWGMLHGSSIVLAAVAVLVGFAAGVMYFGQAWRLKRKLPPGRGLRLPSLEWLERANHRAIVVSVIMLAMGVGSGVILNLIHADRPGDRLPVVRSVGPEHGPDAGLAAGFAAAGRGLQTGPRRPQSRLSDGGQFLVPGTYAGRDAVPHAARRPGIGRRARARLGELASFELGSLQPRALARGWTDDRASLIPG